MAEIQFTEAAETVVELALPYEPAPLFARSPLQDDSLFAGNLGKRIGILIVAYNALNTLPKVLKRITPNVWRNVEEIAVFDDASQDATYEVALGMKALRGLPKLRVLKHERNLGYGGNQKAGYRYFIDKGFDIVVLLHGDGQYAPEILSHLYRPLVLGEADAVFGSRMMKDYGGALKGGMPLYKYVGNRVLTAFENRALGLHLTEFHSGYRAYSLHALKQIDLTHMTGDFHFDTEIIIKLQHQHFTIKEVPVPTYYGNEVCYVNGLRYASDVFRTLHRYRQTCRSVKCHPEYREYFLHYPIKQSRYSSHYFARQMAGTNRDILELGCGDGHLAEELLKDGHRTTGIDAPAQPKKLDAFERYFSADLEAGVGGVIGQLGGKRFDRVLLLDILEHLKNSRQLLRECKELIKPDGRVIVSVPNIANITVRFALLFGRFDYADRGILDESHVRFFTRKTARRFLENNGYRILQERATVMPVELVLGLSPSNPLMRAINRMLAAATKLFPGLFGYQFIFLARPANAPPPTASSRPRATAEADPE